MDNEDVLRYIKRLKNMGFSIYHIAKMRVDEIKNILNVDNGVAESIILYARMTVEKNMESRGKRYPNEIMKLPYIGVKRAEKLSRENLKIENIAKMKPEQLMNILNISRKMAEDIIIAAEITVESRKEEREKEQKEEFKNRRIKETPPGIIKLRSGSVVNGNGLINGRGLINGMGQRREKRGMKKIPIIIFMIFMILLPIFLTTVFTPVHIIKIDGKFGDWNNIQGYPDTRNDATPDIVLLKLFIGDSTYFYCQSSKNLFEKPEDLIVLIDADRNPNTGYMLNGLGADFYAHVWGWNGKIMGKGLYYFNSTNRFNWKGFSYYGGIDAAFSGNRIEMRIPLKLKNPKIYAFLRGENGSMDESDLAIGRDGGYEIKAYNGNPFERIEIRGIKEGEITLHLGVIGNIANISYQLKVYLDNGDEVWDSKDSLISQNLSIKLNSVENALLFIVPKVSGSGTLGFVIKNAVSSYPSRIINSISPVNFSSMGIKIDGNFDDWKNIKGHDDPLGDVSGNKNYTHENIDILKIKRYGSDFYIKTAAPIMAGDVVPIFRFFSPPDSDHDTVPDSVDPYPHDFNNDGIPDNESYVIVNGTKLPDVDGDGIADYPYGPDMWLNTTIPSWFPKPYAGKEVHRYIGPLPKVPLTGNDTFFVFIDTGKEKHEYPGDYMVLIQGRGFTAKAKLMHYSSGKWKFVRYVKIAFFGCELEGDATISGNITVISEDWLKQRDNTVRINGSVTILRDGNLNITSHSSPSVLAVYQNQVLYWNGTMSFDNLTLINCTVVVNGTLELDVRFNFYMDANTIITANGTGYHGGKGGNSTFLNGTDGGGPGYGSGADSSGGGGGGAYGGYGGDGGGDNGSGGSPYGTYSGMDIDMGSGGGGGAARITPGGIVLNGGDGGNGGGCIKIYGENITIDGNIYANGSNGESAPGGGSGGGGSGGRIKIFYKYNIAINGSFNVSGGRGGIGSSSGQNGENGTVYIGKIPEFSKLYILIPVSIYLAFLVVNPQVKRLWRFRRVRKKIQSSWHRKKR